LVFKASRGIEDIYELTYIRKDGSRFPAVVSVTALRDAQDAIIGYLLIGTDNTARKQAEEALLKAGALQSAIFNSANFSSIATDAKGVIQIFNVGAERMLGYTAADVMNKITPADISDPQEVIARAKALSIELGTPITPGFEALVFKASRGIEDIYELTYIRKDGSRLPAVVSVTALRDGHNAIIGYLLIGTDNTARKHVDTERKRLEQVLQGKNVELERANQAKSDFLSSMSHELRSPLNAILGFAQLMATDTATITPTQKASVGQILHAGWYLLELINGILDLAQIESGKVSLSLEEVSLPEVLVECQAMIEPQCQARSITMSFCRFELPCFVHADRTRLKQVVINLLSNALKYNRVGGSVTVECATNLPERVRISISDSGAGLPPEKLAQLFEPFNRLGQETGAEEGTGIGLVVSKRLVELMGGTIGVESTVGVGSVFWIELKAAVAPEVHLEALGSTAAPQPQVRPGARLRTLLYVEDNPANLSLVEQLITRCPDLRLLSARNGNLGIQIARDALPDVILMDINLPGLSGLEALKILRDDPVTSHIPVVALSANALPRDIKKGLEAGFFQYLTKPIDVNEFMDTLNVALEFADRADRPHK
jgi:PAS domain S-box-containing protein